MGTFYGEAEKNILKTWLYLTVFSLLLIGVGWGISYATGNYIILYFAVAFSIITSFFSYWKSDRIVLKMNNAEEASEKEYPEIHDIVENLAITVGLPKPEIYIIDERQPNAFATGRNPENSVIAVTQGLLDRLDRDEIEGVLAHEMSHIQNRDVLLSTVAVVIAGAITMAAHIFLRATIFGRGGNSRDEGGGALIKLGIALVIALLAPIFATLLRLAVSRKREYLADNSAVLITRYPEGLASALEKISGSGEKMESANEATANLYISNPLRGDQDSGFMRKLFMTHPPVEERIDRIRNIDVQ